MSQVVYAGTAPPGLATFPADGPHVDAYTAALAALLEELRAWQVAVDAANPSARAGAFDAWMDQHSSNFSDARTAGWHVPVTCYARLWPLLPEWLIEGCRQNLDPRYDFPTADLRSLTAQNLNRCLRRLAAEDFIPFDQAWLTRARETRRLVDRSHPRDDWSGPLLVQPGLLQLDGDGRGSPGTLAVLLLKARGVVPGRTWLDGANRLLASPQGSAATMAARRWMDVLAGGGVAMPSIRMHQFAVLFTSYNAHVWQGIAAHGSVRAAAIAELCGLARIGQYPNGSSWFNCHADHPALLSDTNEAVLRGCIWLLSFDGGPENVAVLQRTALACLVQAPSASGMKYRSLKGINSCIWSLGQIATPEAVAALGRIGMRVRDERLAKQLARAMSEAAGRADMSIEDLQEVAVPSHDLDTAGKRRIDLATGYVATLSVAGSTRVDVMVLRPDGKTVKTLPASVRADADSATALKNLQISAKELKQALPVHRLRLERTWLTGRTWTGAMFRERMIEHDVMAWFTSRLIWTVTPAVGGARTCLFQADGTGTNADERPQPPLRDDDTVALWHPLDAAKPEMSHRWRDMLERRGIVQPIKQAHRETYPLTVAEMATGDYSNRFAGHIIRQAQANSLARLRGWSCRSRISADVPNDEPTHLRIPAFGLAAEYWTEGAGGDDPEVTDGAAYIFLQTDRVRFRRLQDRGDWRRDGGRGLVLGVEAVMLATIPPIVLSEVMRDIDLFVGVASIGHDPAWADAGAAAQHPSQWRRGAADAYWHSFNGAELTESARTRHAFLANLVPKLAIAGRLRLEERHLVVQGDLGRYRIHIGSGNITMEPDGRYLCVVPGPTNARQASSIALPFEGDKLLSVILSKAAMLAEDTAITDPTIRTQLRR